MTIPRSAQVDLSATRFYHCIARCVRQSYLCGINFEKNKDFSHRKQWILDRIHHLANAFFIDVCAFAVMSNHYHIVLHVNQIDVKLASFDELLARWKLVFSNDADEIQKKIKKLGKHNQEYKKEITKKLQHDLTSISRFMGSINEVIAKMANHEDGVKGRFWDGRFKSQALLDDGALLCTMAYVDLNPIRAGLALTPELSDFTSIQMRLRHLQACFNQPIAKQPKKLMPFINQTSSQLIGQSIPFELKDYLVLVDTTGRMIKEGKKGAIPIECAPILQRLQLTQSGWFKMIHSVEKSFAYAIGSAVSLTHFMPGLRSRKSKYLDFAEQCYFGVAA